MKKVLCILILSALILVPAHPALGGSSLDILYQKVQTPDYSRAGAIARVMSSSLGEPETVAAEAVEGITTFGEREYIAIDVDGENNMRLVIRSGNQAYCWNVNAGLQQSIARRAYDSALACYYSDAEAGKVYYTETLKSGPSGFFETFEEFLDAIDRVQESKAIKRLTENRMEGDRFLALFARVQFGDPEDAVAKEYDISEREEADGKVILTCRNTDMIRELSDGLEKSVILLQFDFSDRALTGCSLLAGDPDGNYAYCKAYLTALYGEPVRTDPETMRTDPERNVEDGNIYLWTKDGMRIWIEEIGGAMTAIHYEAD